MSLSSNCSEPGPTRRSLLGALILAAVASRRKASAQSTPTPSIQSSRFPVPLVDMSGVVTARYNASANSLIEDLGAGVSLSMSVIPSGAFTMGSDPSLGHPEETPAHLVDVPSFALGTDPVTVGQWLRVATFPKVSTDLHAVNGVDPSVPIDDLFWTEAVEFCARLQQYTGRAYRLPSEAEWEYACRAGTTTKYHFGDGISREVSNYNDGITRPISLTPPGAKQAPNRFGLNDMHGDVMELCSDWWHDSYIGGPTDGSSWSFGGDPLSRLTRGGSFLFGADNARAAFRYKWDVREAASGAGFRVALDLSSGISDPLVGNSGILSAGSLVSGAVAPGEIVTVKGQFGVSGSALLTLDGQNLALTSLLGVRIRFNDYAAPLVYVSTSQINAIVPYEVANLSSVWVAVECQGQTSLPLEVSVAPSSPAVFTLDSSGTGQAAAVNQDGTLNGAANPARSGSWISIYGTGEGQTSPPGVDGRITPASLPQPVLPVQFFIGGVQAQVGYAGAAPGEIAGVLQVNARVPDGVAPGPQPIVLQVGQIGSQSGVWIFVG